MIIYKFYINISTSIEKIYIFNAIRAIVYTHTHTQYIYVHTIHINEICNYKL